MLEYEELRVRVRRVGPSRYLVAANGPAAASAVITVDGEPAEYREQWDRLIAAELGLAPLGEDEAGVLLRELGRQVYGLLFDGVLGTCLDTALARAQNLRPSRGLRLRFDLPPELLDLPVEALCTPSSQPQQSLALSNDMSLVRSLRGQSLGQRQPDPDDRPSQIRLVVAWASPADDGLPLLRPGVELDALARELPQLAVTTTVLEHATRQSLEDTLRTDSELPAIVLLIAHGMYDHDLGKGVVLLEDTDGGVDPVPADLLSGILLRDPRVRLVALNLCAGADTTSFEPFSGLAQALIGKGVPAVVAMRGRVSDVSAGAFGPVLLKSLASNKSIDESMATARRHIAHLPRHTAVEWATPTLFLHEAYREGWLFKAREVREKGGVAADPLRDGARALRTLRQPTGHVNSAMLIKAARYERSRGGWEEVLRILQTDTQLYREERQHLREEAALELAWPEVESLCALLAQAGPASAKGAAVKFAELKRQPFGPHLSLTGEVEQLLGLGALLEEARAAMAKADWAAALRCLDTVATARPDGFGDARTLRTLAREELRLSAAYEAAARAYRAGRWEEAARRYGEVAAAGPRRRPDAAARSAYARGRSREERGNWSRAVASYAQCAALGDTAARSAYVHGRAAADENDWRRARDAFTEAVARGFTDAGPDAGPGVVCGSGADGVADGRAHDALTDRTDDRTDDGAHAGADDGADTPPHLQQHPEPHTDPAPTSAPSSPQGLAHRWVHYSAGRAAQAEALWAEAAEAYAVVSGFLDSTVRLLVSRGHAAAGRGDWLGALRALEAAEEEGWDAGGWVEQAREWVYAAGVEGAEGGDWPGVSLLLGALPGGYRDAAARRHYAEGRSAGADGDWERAAEAYGRSEHADAPALRGYALARGCEREQRWEEAVGHLAALPPRLLDVPARLLYAQGRIADYRSDWPGVIDGFGWLPNAYEDGDVGSRRLHARARIAGARGDWRSVLSLLADQPDHERAGTVGLLRRKAAGGQAEESGDWARALEIYAPVVAADITPGDGELWLLHGYVLGRTKELGGRWDEALLAYRELPDDCRDVATRRAYAGAVLGERTASAAADWHAVAAAYEALPADFEDARHRAAYAHTRRAEADGDWEETARRARALGAYRDAPRVHAHARGRLAEARQEWRAAADAFRECAGYGEADAHLAYAGGRDLEQAGQWAAAIEAYGAALGGYDRADARRRRLRRLLDLLPWADGLTASPLVADPFAPTDRAFPYLALRDVGVGPGVSMETVNDAAYALLERGGMTWTERVAWDRVRNPARRLRLDALLYRLHAPQALMTELAALSPQAGQDALDVLCAGLPQDTPLLLLLARGRDAALEAWGERLRAAPGDMATVHALAVARLWQAQELEQSGAWEHAVVAWEFALAYWTTLLADDTYWDGWGVERAACYERPVTGEDMDRLRRDLGGHLFDQLAVYEHRHTERKRPEQARAYAALHDMLEAEMGGARVLKEAGSARWEADESARAGTNGIPPCGPAYLRLLNLEVPLGELVARLDEAARRGSGPGEQAVRELRWAFSELSSPYAHCEVHKFPQARLELRVVHTLAALPADCAGPAAAPDPAAHMRQCAHCQDFLDRNPAYARLPRRRARLLQDTVDLAVHVRLELARAALTAGGGPDRALEEWDEAVRLSRKAGMQIRTKRAVVQMVLGRSDALLDAVGARSGEYLDEAVRLVERVVPLLLPLDRDLVAQLDVRLSELLSLRGVWRGSTRERFGLAVDVESAEADLRRGLRLNPASGHARVNLVRSLVYTLGRRTGGDHEQVAVIHEALEILQAGMERALEHGFQEALGDTLVQLERLLANRLGFLELGLTMARLSEETAPLDGDLVAWAQELAARAQAELDRGAVLSGLQYLIRATRADPSNVSVRRALLDTTGDWLRQLTEEARTAAEARTQAAARTAETEEADPR